MASHAPIKLAFNSVEPEDCEKEKAPIIFLHGVTACKEHWQGIPQAVANKTKRKVYVVDARNHGDSEWTDVYNFDCNGVDLLHFMDSKHIPKAIIVGHSMGGITGIKTALKSPERVEKLVVEDINVTQPPQQILDMIVLYLSLSQTAMQKLPIDATAEEAQKFIKDFVLNGLPPEIKEQHRLTKTNVENFRAFLRRDENGRFAFKSNIDVILKAMKNSKGLMSDHVGVYEGPAYFIYGTISPFLVGSDEPNTRKFFPNVELIPIENATHDVHTDCPEEFTEALVKCLMK